MFKPRLTRPESGNPYYNTKARGGYSRAIKGKPTDSGCDVLSNCVGYAVGRFHEICGRKEMDYVDPVNAENLFANAQQHGMKTGDKPQLGALMIWQKGATLSGSDGAGHVAVVEQINADGTIVVSESGYGCANPFWTTVRKSPWYYGTGFKFLGFVYQPAVKNNPYPAPTRTLKKGYFGTDVKWLQWGLIESGYLRENEIDGSFGNITLGGVCAFQLESSLKVDGICGAQTVKALENLSIWGEV